MALNFQGHDMAWTKARKAKFQATMAARKFRSGTAMIPLDAISERKVIDVPQRAIRRAPQQTTDRELAVKLLEVATALLIRK